MVARKIVVLAIVLIVIVAIAGLAIYYYDAYHKLTFQLGGVSVGNVSLTSVTANFVITIGNPNQLPVVVPSGSFQIYVNNQYLGKGTFGSQTIAGNSKDQITAPVTFSAASISSALYGVIIGGGTVTVTIQGSANLVLFSVPFEATLYNANFR